MLGYRGVDPPHTAYATGCMPQATEHYKYFIASMAGAMFSYNPIGIALASVGPDIPSVMNDSTDFTTHIRDDVIKKLSK